MVKELGKLMDIHSKRLVSTTTSLFGMGRGGMDIHSKRLVSTTGIVEHLHVHRWIYILKDW